MSDRHEPQPPNRAAPRVLCVDDDSRTLAALGREMRRAGYHPLAAESVAAATAVLQDPGSRPDVIIADLRLPDGDGIALLADAAREQPSSVRILLTGFADFEASLRAINQGHVFAFLEKPWQRQDLAATVAAGLEQQRASADRAAFQEAVEPPTGAAADGDIRPLLERLEALQSPVKCGHGTRLAGLLRGLCGYLHLRPDTVDEICLAARLHDVGESALPFAIQETPELRLRGAALAEYRRHPEIMADILETVPRLRQVASIVRLHHERWDGNGFPEGRRGNAIPAPVRVLRVLDVFDEALHGHYAAQRMSVDEARALIREESGRLFDPRAVNAFLRWQAQQTPASQEQTGVAVIDLRPGMVLARDLITPDGVLLVPAGHRLSPALLQRVQSLSSRFAETLRVEVRAAEPPP
jgi:response regulator RpfG family c-di-GMP phosphodiesterase